ISTLQRYHTDFYVYLFSNASPHLYPNNTASRFTTELHTPIDFAPGDVSNWEVGLSELMIPSTYYNITEGANVISVQTVRAVGRKRPGIFDDTAAIIKRLKPSPPPPPRDPTPPPPREPTPPPEQPPPKQPTPPPREPTPPPEQPTPPLTPKQPQQPSPQQ